MLQSTLTNLKADALSLCASTLRGIVLEAAASAASSVLKTPLEKDMAFTLASGAQALVNPKFSTVVLDGQPVISISDLAEICDRLHSVLGQSPAPDAPAVEAPAPVPAAPEVHVELAPVPSVTVTAPV